MKLTILERLQIQTIIPKEGDVVTLIHVKDILDKVQITSEEAVACDLKQEENGMVTFNIEKSAIKDVKFNVEQTILIKGVLQKKSDEKKLHLELLDLYQKFEKV